MAKVLSDVFRIRSHRVFVPPCSYTDLWLTVNSLAKLQLRQMAGQSRNVQFVQQQKIERERGEGRKRDREGAEDERNLLHNSRESNRVRSRAINCASTQLLTLAREIGGMTSSSQQHLLMSPR